MVILRIRVNNELYATFLVEFLFPFAVISLGKYIITWSEDVDDEQSLVCLVFTDAP